MKAVGGSATVATRLRGGSGSTGTPPPRPVPVVPPVVGGHVQARVVAVEAEDRHVVPLAAMPATKRSDGALRSSRVTPMTQKQSRVLWLVESDSEEEEEEEDGRRRRMRAAWRGSSRGGRARRGGGPRAPAAEARRRTSTRKRSPPCPLVVLVPSSSPLHRRLCYCCRGCRCGRARA